MGVNELILCGFVQKHIGNSWSFILLLRRVTIMDVSKMLNLFALDERPRSISGLSTGLSTQAL